jgi:hypothetical protein
MFNKILFGISAFMFIFCAISIIAFAYLTRVGFYNAIHGLILIVLAIMGTACFGIAAIKFEALTNGKRR